MLGREALWLSVGALPAGSEDPWLKASCAWKFSKDSAHPRIVGTQLSSELGRVKVVGNRSGTPRHLHCYWCRIAIKQRLPHTAIGYGNSLNLFFIKKKVRREPNIYHLFI